jgi:lipoprotein NlpD
VARQPAKAAPVVPEAAPNGQHVVQNGDTLFSIAFQNGLDYRDLAFWNNLPSPDVIKVGQMLRLTPPDDAAGRARGVQTVPLRETALPKPLAIAEAPLLTEPRAQRLPYSEANWAAVAGAKLAAIASAAGTVEIPQVPAATVQEQNGWRWPAEGPLLGTYGEDGGKGINIAGERNAPVVAALPGKVVYSGAGLRGYGKMLIVKHLDEFLTAYAHNQTLLAKEGDWVKGGQKIAEMGDTDSDRIKLHFEVRQYGKPLDPMKYLPERK